MKMKRFLALFLCLTMLLSLLPAVAQADSYDYYLCGSFNDWGDALNSVENKLTEVSPGIFRIEHQFNANEEFKIVKKSASETRWDDFGGNYVVDASEASNTKYVYCDGSSIWLGYDLDNGYYLVGDSIGWRSQSQYKMTATNDGKYYIDLTVAGGSSTWHEFKVSEVTTWDVDSIVWPTGQSYWIAGGARRIYFDPNHEYDSTQHGGEGYMLAKALYADASDGYYLVGGTAVNGANTWTPVAENKLTQTGSSTYSLVKEFTYAPQSGDSTVEQEYNQYKIVQVSDHIITNWYPAGDNNNRTLANSGITSGSETKIHRIIFDPNNGLSPIQDNIVYQVLTPELSNGSIEVSPTYAAEGESVTVTVTQANGYQLKDDSLCYKKKLSETYWAKVSVISTANNPISFNMPDYDVQVVAEFEQIPTYSVSVFNLITAAAVSSVSATVNDEPANISNNEFTAAENDTVIVSVVANEGCRIDSLTINGDETGSENWSTGPSITFTMPGEPVTFSLRQWKTVYPINTVIVGSGTVTTTVNSGYEVFAADEAGIGEDCEDIVTVNATPAAGYRLDGFTVVGDSGGSIEVDYSSNTFAMPGEPVTVTATFVRTPVEKVKAVYKNLEIAGVIGVNFALQLPDGVTPDQVKAYFTVGGTTTTEVSLPAAANAEGLYEVSYKFAAKDISQEVTLTVKLNGTLSLLNSADQDVSEVGITTSVKAMCDEYEGTAEMTPSVKALAQSMEDYGAYAANYFNSTALPEGTTEVTEANDNAIKSFTRTKEVYVANKVKLKSVYLTLESETTLNLRFEALTGSLTDYTFWLGDVELTPVNGVVKITNIAAPDLDKVFTVTVKSGNTEVYTVTCSALYYAKLVLSSDNDSVATAELKNLMRALYLYWQTAKAAFPQQPQA